MLYFIFAILIVLLDQLFKYWITISLSAGEQIFLIPGVIHLTFQQNTGAAFSIFPDMRWILVGISAVCVILVIVVMFKYPMRPLGLLSLAAVLGGALGNMIDRVFQGYVVDMFEVEFMRFAVFNIADIFITVGGIVFCIYYIVHTGKDGKRKKKLSNAPPAENQPERTWTETEILAEYEIEQLLSEDDRDGNQD